MNQKEFERLPAGGAGVEAALARLKRENPDAYAAHVSVMHRRPRGGVAVQEYSPVRGTLAHAAWTAMQVMYGQADENDALVAPTPTRLRPTGLVGMLSCLPAVGPVRCRGQRASNPSRSSSAIELRTYMSAARAAAGVESLYVNSPLGAYSFRANFDSYSHVLRSTTLLA